MERKVFDVIVAGGGISGCAAAVSAKRCGASVLVIERAGYLGGALTDCGVGPMMTFHASEKQVILGFMQEVVDRLVKRGYSRGHSPDTKQYTDTLTSFNAEGLKLILDEMLTETECEVLFHTMIGAVATEHDRIQSITICNKDGLSEITGTVFIDATGDGDIAAWAGAPMTKGRAKDGAMQPMTLKMKYANVDTQKLRTYILDHPEEFPLLKNCQHLVKQDIPLDVEGLDRKVATEKSAGRLSIGRGNILMHGTNRDGEYIVNTTRVMGCDGTSAASLSEAEREGRRQCEQVDHFLHRCVPGYENALLEFTGPSIGVRMTRQLVGAYTLTAEDLLSCKKFENVIAHSAYPIDVHSPDDGATNSVFLGKGSYYDIPYETLYCPQISNLLTVGRCISATFEAQAAIRVTPTAGSIGQAGGIAAALAMQTGGDVRRISTKELQKKLLEQKAYLDMAL